ncbi:hypothetical protein KJI95_15965 [Shewanella sp. JM162201]|uniref:Uncharacterized protein n=1 Tax=Shewanella jiangmenensis TaxID=2837387 RepID=A0ABS5V6B9_9GAMM|nr:hypothetical protein [Shewanella jiangmenensis]
MKYNNRRGSHLCQFHLNDFLMNCHQLVPHSAALALKINSLIQHSANSSTKMTAEYGSTSRYRLAGLTRSRKPLRLGLWMVTASGNKRVEKMIE